MNPVDVIIATSEAVTAGAAAFEATQVTGASEATSIVSGGVAFLTKLMPTDLFSTDQNLVIAIESVVAGGTAYVAASASGGTLMVAAIAGVIAFLTKLTPTKLLGSGPKNP